MKRIHPTSKILFSIPDKRITAYEPKIMQSLNRNSSNLPKCFWPWKQGLFVLFIINTLPTKEFHTFIFVNSRIFSKFSCTWNLWIFRQCYKNIVKFSHIHQGISNTYGKRHEQGFVISFCQFKWIKPKHKIE